MTIQDLARGFASSVQSSVTAVTTAVGDLQNSGTATSDEIDAAVAGASTINTALQNFIAQDVNSAFATSTGDATAKLPVVQKLLYDEQSSIAAHAATGFVPPPDATTLANAIAAWQSVLSDINGGFLSTAAAIDQATAGSSAQASAGGAAQAAAEAAQAAAQQSAAQSAAASQQAAAAAAAQQKNQSGNSGGGSTTSGGGSSGGSLPPAVVATATAKPASTASASVLPAVSPAAAVFVGVGLIVVVGLATGYLTVPKEVDKTLGALGLKKNPRRRRKAR